MNVNGFITKILSQLSSQVQTKYQTEQIIRETTHSVCNETKYLLKMH